MESYKHLYSKTLIHNPLHFAAHSHHPWPDCTVDAHVQYWMDSAKLLDNKWDHIFSEIISGLQKNIAKTLNLSNPYQIVFAPNTHEFVNRILSCIQKPNYQKIKVLSTDSEFHSFNRQARRWVEADIADVDFVSVEPYDTFATRWLEKSKNSDYDIIFTSYVFFNSGLKCPELSTWVPMVPPKTMIVIDGYHSFYALPMDLSIVENRIFFMAGGYKYAQSGEGACFLYTPENTYRPVNTGWFASFETLNQTEQSTVEYSNSMRFAGSTFDPAGCYRMNAVYKMYEEHALTIGKIHERVQTLKKYFFDKVDHMDTFSNPILENNQQTQSHFLTFKLDQAEAVQELLQKNGITVDSRGDRLRFGFGLYHDLKDLDHLVQKLRTIVK